MTRGLSVCRVCGKSVPSFFRRDHERRLCLRMRYLRGDPDVICRFDHVPPCKAKSWVDSRQQSILKFVEDVC